jgi:hypothetical protein
LLPPRLFILGFFVLPQSSAYLFIPVGCRTLVGSLLVACPHRLCVAPSRLQIAQLRLAWLMVIPEGLSVNSSGTNPSLLNGRAKSMYLSKKVMILYFWKFIIPIKLHNAYVLSSTVPI